MSPRVVLSVARRARRLRVLSLLAPLLGLLLLVTGCGTADPTGGGAGAASGGSSAGAASGGPGASASGAPGESAAINTSPGQNRIRVKKDDAAATLVPPKIAQRGSLIVATTANSVPLDFHATDNKTVIGAEMDIAQLIADKLGLNLEVKVTSWEDWPLKTRSGDYDTVFSNVGINDERKKLFDFASYRAAYMAFLATSDSTLKINGAADISGLKIAVGSGTNQEKMLLSWNAELTKEGKAPAELIYLGNVTDMLLPLRSHRIDVGVLPYPTAVYEQSSVPGLKIVGRVNPLAPNEPLVAAPTAKGNGLAVALSAAVNSAIADGSYQEALDRWHLGNEALDHSKVVTETSK